MASNNDAKNKNSVTDLLPEVYRSEVSKTLMSASFDKFLSKDDTTHVAGYIGQGNPSAQINRQLQEPTPHRQAFQLAPVMHTVAGTNEFVLTYKGFLQQLELMGVDTQNVDQWANTTTFNWVPPINLDMFVNYADYFWKPSLRQTPPQHFTIENRCNKVLGRLRAYQTILARRGKTMDVLRIDFAANALVVAGKQDDLFVDGFTFSAKGTTNVNLINKRWVSTGSSYDGTADETTITVSPALALSSTVTYITEPITPPTADYVGQWWYKHGATPSVQLSQLHTWTGEEWVAISQSVPFHISLVEQEAVYQTEANCACESDVGGWDVKQWDDGQKDALVWNTDLLANISFSTELEWVTHNTQTSPFDLWYDLSSDALKQRSSDDTAWVVVQPNFSQVLIESTGTVQWDASSGCIVQTPNQWTEQNQWVHKSELTSFVGAKRAQVPILEYSSELEMNEWTEQTYGWKYRAENTHAFNAVDAQPSRLELEPIKSYVAHNVDGVWYLYLATDKSSALRDIDYTSTFVPGYKFRIVDRVGLSALFTVADSVYREAVTTDPADVPVGSFVTVVKLAETDFTAPVIAGAEYEKSATEAIPPYTRIEPIVTSQGDSWQGYHAHWMLDVTRTVTRPVGPQMVNPYVKNSKTLPTSTFTVPGGTVYVNDVSQEFVAAGTGVTTVNLDYRFHYKQNTTGVFAVAGENTLRVYINGVRQYGTYEEIAYLSAARPDYTIVDKAGLPYAVASTGFRYVYAIRFTKPLAVNDIVRIEVAPASYHDMGMSCIPVRTIEDDQQFIAAVNDGTQPSYKSLVRYHKTEQVKTSVNQYPQYNIYDIITGDVVKTSPIFTFAEDNAQPVDSSTQRRIVTDSTGKEFMFEQHLSDDAGTLYAYRMVTGSEPKYWYSPYTQKFKQWDGQAWTEVFLASGATGTTAVTPVVSATEPVGLRTQHASVWVNPETVEFRQRDAVTGVWNIIGDVVVSAADPTLHTIWKQPKTPLNYTPKYVDRSGQAVDRSSSEGDWEVLSQWRNNPEHENRKQVLYSQLITHLTSVVANQTRIPGLTNNGIFSLLQQEYDYGVGGTIKEHNDAFDTLVSAVNVTEMTPVGVIEFACEQYATNGVAMRDTFTSSVVSTLIGYSGYTVEQITKTVVSDCISKFANNDFMSKVYGDTTAYNEGAGVGVPNWIATAPMFGLAPKTVPHVVKNGSTAILTHHDGHKSYIVVSPAEQDKLSRMLVKTLELSAPGVAVMSATEPTDRPVYWYKVGGGRNVLYKRNGGVWDVVDFTDMLSGLMLEIENRLYAAVPSFPVPVFDYAMLVNTPEDKASYDARMRTRFMRYVSTKSIKAPFVNTGYNLTDPFTWNYAQSINDVLPRTGVENVSRSCWQSVYELWYGTAFPHLEPWALQGYTSKPSWWDAEYLDTTGTRRWRYNHASKVGMWENIRTGTIPSGYHYPNGIVSSGDSAADGVNIPTYNYFSVNISDGVITGGYAPDALLPPYYDNTDTAATHPTVRSVYRVFSTQVIAPSADYSFGSQGPAEWDWLHSLERVYDRAIVAFLMQPVRFLHQTFGPGYVTVNGLHFDVTTKKVYSHRDALFHGDIYQTDKQYTANGLNQWYVNFNRYRGFDTNVGFRTMWTQWTPKQSYQFAGIIDTGTLEVFNKNFDVTDRDFSVVLANSGVLNEVWADAFNVSIMTIPPAIRQYNNQARWKFSVDTTTAAPREVRYYGTQVWPFYLDTEANTLTAFKYEIANVTAAINTFEIRGDQTHFLYDGLKIVITGSSTNDGTYTIARSVFNTVDRTTKITVVEPVATSTIDGVIDIPSYAHNWVTGDRVVMNSTALLPYPIEIETPYYVIAVDSRTIRLAQTEADAIIDVAVDILGPVEGDITVGKVKTTFQALGGGGYTDELWYHFELNEDDVRTIEPPFVVLGMQNLIDFIDGYEAYQRSVGVVYNSSADFVEYDSETGRPVSWQLEVERFIDWSYSLRQSRLQINDRYEFTVGSVVDSSLRFVGGAPAWEKGTKVALTTTGTLPTPLFAGTAYYIVPSETDPQQFRLSVSPNITREDNIVELSGTGSGKMQLALYSRDQAYPEFEMNPHRNNVWISTPQGMLSNVIMGPYSDIRTSQTIYDQYGRSLTADKLTIYRQDQQTRVAVRPEIVNDRLINAFDADEYNYIHIGGGHFFVEGYEHILMFNNYTVGGDLVYDPFLGLYIKRFDLDYYESADYTLRPVMGGYFLSGNELVRNIEGSIQDMRDYYDVYDLVEGTPEARHARGAVGYATSEGNMTYLDYLNVNAKSQFLFYRGMIQAKGSVSSVKAYINSKKFIDAKMDEFWAYKVAEFGDSRAKQHPRIKMFATDSNKPDVRLKFVLPTDIDTAQVYDAARGFETVSFGDNRRWVDFPQQRTEVESALFLDAAIKTMTRIYASQSYTNGMVDAIPHDAQGTVDVWVHIERVQSDDSVKNIHTRRWINGNWEVTTGPRINVVGYDVYMDMGGINDGVRVLRRRLTQPRHLSSFQTELMNEADYANAYVRVNSEVIKFAADRPIPFVGVDHSSKGRGRSLLVTSEYAGMFMPGDKMKLTGDGIAAGAFVTVRSTEMADVFEGDSPRIDGLTRVYFTEDSGNGLTGITNGTITRYGFADILIVFGVSSTPDKINPARLYDVQSHVKVRDIPLWHPAAGIHDQRALHNVDIVSDADPAQYTVVDPTNASPSLQPWMAPEVGKMWLDTTHLAYMPYYDDVIYPDIDTRLSKWGKLQPWSDVKVYQWVETLIDPYQWDATVSKQQSGSTTFTLDKVTGTPRKTVYKRVRQRDSISVVIETLGSVQLSSSYNTYTDGDLILIGADSSGSLPSTIEGGVTYTVSQYDADNNTFTVTDAYGQPVDLTGAGMLYVVKPFSDNWVEQRLKHERIHVAMSSALNVTSDGLWDPVLTLTDKQWYDGDKVDVYVNGTLLVSSVEVISNTVDTTGAGYKVDIKDIIDVVRPIHSLTDVEREFNPDIEDDGTTLVQWMEMIQHTTNIRTVDGTTYMFYYYWVEGIEQSRNAADSSMLSAREVAERLATAPSPYMVVQQPSDDEWVRGYDVPPWDSAGYNSATYVAHNAKQHYVPAIFYRKAVLANIAGYINDDNRYVVEFTRDLTLRDRVIDDAQSMVKNKHEKWMMFRREQISAISRDLWIKMTESLMRCRYDNLNVPVPSYEREHYDLVHGTETRYGLDNGQTFVNPDYARATIVDYLQNPVHDFKPIDINDFFTRFPATDDAFWQDPSAVRDMCDYIYNTFDAHHTNGIWFDVLSDALVTKSKYKGLMKTSWLALHGIRILDVSGQFDD